MSSTLNNLNIELNKTFSCIGSGHGLKLHLRLKERHKTERQLVLPASALPGRINAHGFTVRLCVLSVSTG